MQTIILAGGEGTRLRPLTADTPKPLIKILGEPTIERLLRNLRSAGIRSATVCTHYLGDVLRDALGTQSHGVRLKYCREEYPLGTAGCVRLAWNGDDVMILSGDGVCGFDYRAILDFHASSGADITIVAREVDDPREYGLMTVSDDMRVTGFIEKPGYDDCLTNLANTGAYVISKDIIARIPEGEKVDFAQDVFPKMLAEGKRLCVYKDVSFWYDIGDIPSLLKCQRELLEREGKHSLIMPTASVAPDATVSDTVIEDGAALGKGSRAMSSLICEGATVAGGADISEAVIGKNVTTGEGLIMKRFSALGEGCVVGSSVTIETGARIAPRTKIPDGAIIRTDILGGEFTALSFSDGGEAHGLHGASEHLRFGAAVGAALAISEIALGGNGENFEALSLGLRSSGVTVYSLQGASLGETVFCARQLGCAYCAFVDENVHLISSGSMTLARPDERKVEQAYNRSTYSDSAHGRLIDGAAVSNLYLNHLRELMPEGPQISILLRTDSEREAAVFSEIVRDSEGERVTFTIASDRRTVSATTDGAVVPYENLLILCCKAHFQHRRSVVVPPRAPLLCDKLAAESRSSVMRTATQAHPLSLFCCDPLVLISELVQYLTERKISLTEAVSELPEVVYTKRIIETPEGLPKIMSEGFKGAKAGGDVMLEREGARAFVRPLKSGRAVSLYIESVSQEAAGEISADVIRRLKQT